MLLNKTKLGLDVFDRAFGGVYLGRATLVCGARASGKSLLAAQFCSKVLQTGECACVLADRNLDDFFLDMRTVGADPVAAMESGQLSALSCAGLGGGVGEAASQSAMRSGSVPPLPFPAALEELRRISEERGLKFFVFNSVLPWTAVLPTSDLPERVEAFVSQIERLGITALLLLPQPASDAASKLRDVLSERCAAAIQVAASPAGVRTVSVLRYRGAADGQLPACHEVEIVQGRGFVSPSAAAPLSADSPAEPGALSPAPLRAQHRKLRALVAASAAGAEGEAPAPPAKRFRSLISSTDPDGARPPDPAAPRVRHRFSAVIK